MSEHEDLLQAFARLESVLREMNQHLLQLHHGTALEPNRLTMLLLSQLIHSGDPLSLHRHYGQIYSQNGEDGMIAEIFRRLGGPRNRVFVEIGAGDGIENCTRFWLEQGWHGLWIDGSASNVAAATATFSQYVATGQLRITEALVTPESVAELIAAAGLPDEIDLLSLDIDLNTHWVWQALPLRARVHCLEYNGSIPPSLDVAMPYDPEASWDGSSAFGAGLKWLERIGRAKGLSLVGCDLSGLNAFFVDAQECEGKFRQPYTAETHYEMPKYGRFHWTGHRPSRSARRWVCAR